LGKRGAGGFGSGEKKKAADTRLWEGREFERAQAKVTKESDWVSREKRDG